MKQTDYDVLLKYIKDNETLPLHDIIKGLKLIGKSKWKSDALLSICLFHYQQRTKLNYPVSCKYWFSWSILLHQIIYLCFILPMVWLHFVLMVWNI